MQRDMTGENRVVDMPAEWNGVVPTQVFLDEAQKIVSEGERLGVVLRLMGGAGIRLRTQPYAELGVRLGRLGAVGQQEFTDLDFMTYERHRKQMHTLFMDRLGYGFRRVTPSMAASRRRVYFHPRNWFYVDVFFDLLVVANHPLDFRRRLALDTPTITATDFLLEKLQIVNFGGKDLKDTVLLLRAFPIGDDDRAQINARHLQKLLGGNWGFWYTVTTNLRGLVEVVAEMSELHDDEREVVTERSRQLLKRLDDAPKSLRWQARSLIGPRQRWYELVETQETVGGFGIWQLREDVKRKT
ncbi:MAG: hypothetical protein HY259_14425 [Chloroflexi bacterium]|nr:hypothetical protein [Chloroflexota bacterium]MBI3734630.1 hypothetical protein [Chloroflexota bacterium]